MASFKVRDCDILKVGSSSDCNFSNITSAAATLQHNNAPVILQIMPGKYIGSVVFQCSNIIIEGLGESPEDVIITDSHHATPLRNDGRPVCTFETAVLRTDGNNITIRNLTVANTAGDGSKVGPAVALYTDGNGQTIENCRILGHQNTLFTAPLPELNENGVNEGFGPKGNLARTPSTCIFRKCYIEGDADFIFGGASALFEDCEIHSIANGHISSPSTEAGIEYGYLFKDCTFTCEAETNNVFLSRPWRPYGKAVFSGCRFGSHINSELFCDWLNRNSSETAYFAVEEGSVDTKNCLLGNIFSHEMTRQYYENFTNYLSNFFVKN